MARKDGSFPYDATPDVHHFNGVPESCFDVVNMYGTYNIQPTSDTENRFPLIAPGLPKKLRDMHIGKEDLCLKTMLQVSISEQRGSLRGQGPPQIR